MDQVRLRTAAGFDAEDALEKALDVFLGARVRRREPDGVDRGDGHLAQEHVRRASATRKSCFSRSFSVTSAVPVRTCGSRCAPLPLARSPRPTSSARCTRGHATGTAGRMSGRARGARGRRHGASRAGRPHRLACSEPGDLRARFQRAVDEGDLPADADADMIARYLTTVADGVSVQATGGATPTFNAWSTPHSCTGRPARPTRASQTSDLRRWHEDPRSAKEQLFDGAVRVKSVGCSVGHA